MMMFVLSRFLGLPIPTGLLVFLAVVGALTLGGAALSGERKRQLDQRRGEAAVAVRGSLEAFHLALTKQARDAVRLLEQDLRRRADGVVARRGGDLIDELSAARAAAATADHACIALADIEADLDALAGLRERAHGLIETIGYRAEPPPPRALAFTAVVQTKPTESR